MNNNEVTIYETIEQLWDETNTGSIWDNTGSYVSIVQKHITVSVEEMAAIWNTHIMEV